MKKIVLSTLFLVSFIYLQIINCSSGQTSQPTQNQTAVAPPPPPPEASPEEKKAAAKPMRAALKKNNPSFFETVKPEELDSALSYTDAKGSKVITKIGLRGIPAMLGIFKNQDPQARKKIYSELMFNDYPVKEGETITQAASGNPDDSSYIEMLKAAILENEEKDPDAGLAYQDLIKRLFISPDANKTYKSVLKAVGYEKGNIETKKILIQELEYSASGGPAGVFPDAKKRASKGRKIEKAANKIENQEIKDMLIRIGGLYKSDDAAPPASTPN
ncbi:MAG: hypothetical protein K8R21_12665 [Leptospira sp.]|nr:hypothetical protein [Leptospira sp.]